MVSPIEEAEEFYQHENNKIKMLEIQLIEVMKNNSRLAEENRMFREFISKIGSKIKESVEHVPDFNHQWSENPDQISYRTFKYYDIDRFRFVLDNPSKSIIDIWENLMENAVLDIYVRELNRAFMKLDLSKLYDAVYFYIASEISRLSRRHDI